MSAKVVIRRKIKDEPTAVVGYCTSCKKLFFLEWLFPVWSKCTCTKSALAKRGNQIYAGGKCIPMLFNRADLSKLKDYQTHGIRMRLVGNNNITRITEISPMWIGGEDMR